MGKNDLSNKLVITAALAGAITQKEQNPAVPYTPDEFAEESKKCFDAGASIVHLHVRDPKTGMPTTDLDQYEKVLGAIKSECPDIIINLSTGISPVATDKERIDPVKKFKPPIASLNSNSMNHAVGNWKTGEIKGGAVVQNSFRLIKRYAKTMRRSKTKPEIEIYDLGGMYNILFLSMKEIFENPLYIQFVFGVLGGVPFNHETFSTLLNIKPSTAVWSTCGVAKAQFEAGFCSCALGGHIRVGLEDNIRMPNGKLAKGSWEQVEWASKLAKMIGREVATPNEAREILHLAQ